MITLRVPAIGEPFVLNEGDIILDTQHHETWNPEKEGKIIVGDVMTLTVLRKMPPAEEA